MTSPPVPAATDEFVVEQSPIRTRFIRSHNRFDLSWPNDRALLIKNHRTVRGVAWLFCFLGWPPLLLGLEGLIGSLMKPQAAEFLGVGFLLLWGGTVGVMGIWLLGPRYLFDAADGQLTVRHMWRQRRWPLTRIMAVQVIDAGRFGTRYGGEDASNIEFSSYQLNLVLDEPDEPRIFVTYNHDLTDMARKAKILADFLGVRLLAEGKVQELVQAFSTQDGQTLQDPSQHQRFRGSDSLRGVPDRHLPEPYRSWIDETQPLPVNVRLLPRSVALMHDLGMFVIFGVGMIGMALLVLILFAPALAAAGWIPILVVGVVGLLLALIPLYLLRRLIHTMVAHNQLKRGTLRQGILLDPERMLVRMEPNHCYAIALDRFVQAKIEDAPSRQNPSDFVIETQDGRVAFFQHWLSAPPEQLNQWVAELRSASPPPGQG